MQYMNGSPYLSPAEQPRHYSVGEAPASPYYAQQYPLDHYQSYSLFSPYRQQVPPVFPTEHFPDPQSPSMSMYQSPESRARILSYSEGKKKKGNLVDFVVKYKTEVCKNWEKNGICEFGDRCAFAHGEHELRQKIHVAPQYKTKKCRSFYENGFCPYGSRCQFLHGEALAQQRKVSYSEEIGLLEKYNSPVKPTLPDNLPSEHPRLSFFKDIEAKGEKEDMAQAVKTSEGSTDQVIPTVNIYAAVKKCIINGADSLYFMNALLDLNADLPVTKFISNDLKPRANSMK